jgi:ribosomal silencing factor RsfS
MIIGISGYARTGKDTFGISLQRILKTYKINCELIAFANVLKEDLDGFLLEKFNISAFTKKDEEKFLIRPILVAYGESKRNQSPNYWIDQIKEKVKNKLIIITDVRYENEARWVIDSGGFLIHLNRQRDDGSYIEAPNPQEAKNNPKVENLASLKIVWQTVESDGLVDENTIDQIVESFICSCEDLTEKLQTWKTT